MQIFRRMIRAMGSQWGYDKTYMRAKHEGYRSRAAYKLMEIQKKFSIIRPSDNIVDLGAAPGSWLQVERTLTTARVLGIDLNPIAEIAGVETIEGDLNDPESEVSILLKTRRVWRLKEEYGTEPMIWYVG